MMVHKKDHNCEYAEYKYKGKRDPSFDIDEIKRKAMMEEEYDI